MRVLFFLFLLLLTDVCKGQLPFDYKDEYRPQEDFFGKAKDLPKEKITIPLRHYNKFEPL
jgi:hypothetical protein